MPLCKSWCGRSVLDYFIQSEKRSKITQLESKRKEEILSVNNSGEGFLTGSSTVFVSIAQTDTQEGGSSRRHGTSMVSSASMGILHSSSLHDYTPVSHSENQDSLQVSPLISFPFSLLCLPSSALLFCVILSLCKFS